MAIITVTGVIAKEKLGMTLPHEHIYCDLRPLVSDYEEIGRKRLFAEKLSLQNYGHVRRNPYAILDNAVIDEEDVQLREILAFKRAGGESVVDATTRDFGRDPELLRAMARETGLNIVMGCGHYVDASQSARVKRMDVDELTEEIIGELTEGVGGTGIRAGVIGEIGTGKEITEAEYRALEAACRAQRATGAGMHIHASLYGRTGAEAARFALQKGADPRKLCVDHADAVLDEKYMDELLDMGVWVEFDNFGKEFYVDRRNRNLLEGAFVTDAQRCAKIRRIADAGKLGQLLITNDICLKSLLHAYGGWGYDHILVNIAPMLEDFGLSKRDFKRLMVDNPAEFLDIAGVDKRV